MGIAQKVIYPASGQAASKETVRRGAALDRRATASQQSRLPDSPAKAAGTLAGEVAELPSLEVETRQLWGSGQTGKRCQAFSTHQLKVFTCIAISCDNIHAPRAWRVKMAITQEMIKRASDGSPSD